MNTRQKANIALKARLYVSGWQLSGELLLARKFPDCYHIELYFQEGVPVGVALLKIHHREIMVFVRKSERRKGIGEKLVGAVKHTVGEGVRFHYNEGIQGSWKFWDSVLRLETRYED